MAVAGFLRDALLRIQEELNPILDKIDRNDTVVKIAQELDKATAQVNTLLGKGGDAVKDLNINLSDPLMKGNRWFNDITGDWTLGGLTNTLDSSSNTTTMLARGTTQAEEKSVFDKALDGVGLEKIGNLLGNKTLSRTSRTIANELKAQTQDLDKKVEKQISKTQNSLTERSKELKGIGESLSKAKVGDAAEGAAKFVKERVDRLGKDIKNGVDKVTGKDKKNEAA